MAGSKTTKIGNLTVIHYEDGSTFLELTGTCRYTGLSAEERTSLNRALTAPLYVVKSAHGCYASYDSIDGEHLGYHTALTWTEDRSKAAHFVSKDAARAVVKGVHPAGGARIVRVKR